MKVRSFGRKKRWGQFRVTVKALRRAAAGNWRLVRVACGAPGRVVPSIKVDDAGIAQVEPGIAGVEFKDLKSALGTEDGKGGFAGNLYRALRHPYQQPGFVLVSKHPRIQQACHFHALHTRAQVARPENGVLSEALCKIVHHERFAVLEDRASLRRFATEGAGLRKPLIRLRKRPYFRKGTYCKNL